MGMTTKPSVITPRTNNQRSGPGELSVSDLTTKIANTWSDFLFPARARSNFYVLLTRDFFSASQNSLLFSLKPFLTIDLKHSKSAPSVMVAKIAS
jgi:hypothetical protein